LALGSSLAVGNVRKHRTPISFDDVRDCGACSIAEGGEMSIVAWCLLGLISGFVASKIMNQAGAGIFMDIVLGIFGAVVGGFVFRLIGSNGVTGLNLWSMFVSVLGAMIILAIYHGLAGRTHRTA
jgi:uncharacterized membrane protein YeaQ/YmgE (transglycosylase-associated protein family)